MRSETCNAKRTFRLARKVVGFAIAALAVAASIEALVPGGISRITQAVGDAPAEFARLIVCSDSTRNYPQFFQAIKSGNTTEVAAMRRDCYDPNLLGVAGDTALVAAAKHGDVGILTNLVSEAWPRPKADLGKRDPDGNNFLHHAARACNGPAIEYLYEVHPRLARQLTMQTNQSGVNPRGLALDICAKEIYILLVPGQQAQLPSRFLVSLFRTAPAGNSNTTDKELILEDMRKHIVEDSARSLVILMQVAHAHSLDGNVFLTKTQTALMLSASRNHDRTLEVLIKATPRLDVANTKGKTALMAATAGFAEKSIALLLKYGVSLRDGIGQTRWIPAQQDEEPRFWGKIREYKSDLNVQLRDAVRTRNIPRAFELVKKGANPFANTLHSKTALTLATQIPNESLAIAMVNRLMDAAHNLESPMFQDEIFVSAIMRTDTKDDGVLYSLLDRGLTPDDLGLAVTLLLNRYGLNSKRWDEREINALLMVDKPLYAKDGLGGEVLKTLADNIMEGPTSPMTPEDIFAMFDRFVERGANVQFEAQRVLSTAFRGQWRASKPISLEHFEIRRRAIIDWILDSGIKVAATDELFHSAIWKDSDYLFGLLIDLGISDADVTDVYETLYLAASEKKGEEDRWTSRLDTLMNGEFVPSLDVGRMVLRRFFTWKQPSSGRMALEYFDRGLISHLDAGDAPRFVDSGSTKPCLVRADNAVTLVDRLVKVRRGFSEEVEPREAVLELDILIKGLLGRGHRFSSLEHFGCAYAMSFAKPNRMQGLLGFFPESVAELALRKKLFAENSFAPHVLEEIIRVSRDQPGKTD